MTDYNPRVDVKIPTAQELKAKYGDFLTKTDTVPRPSADDPKYRHMKDQRQVAEMVAADREQWDAAEAEQTRVRDWSAGLRAEREATKAAERKAEDDARMEARTQDRANLEARLKRDFLSQPGAMEDDWERNRQRVIDDHLVRTAGVDDAKARGDFARQMRSAF